MISNDLLQKVENVKMNERFTISSFQKSSLKFHIMFCMKLFPDVLQWLSHQVSNFYDEGIKNLVVRYDLCLDTGGNYVER